MRRGLEMLKAGWGLPELSHFYKAPCRGNQRMGDLEDLVRRELETLKAGRSLPELSYFYKAPCRGSQSMGDLENLVKRELETLKAGRSLPYLSSPCPVPLAGKVASDDGLGSREASLDYPVPARKGREVHAHSLKSQTQHAPEVVTFIF